MSNAPTSADWQADRLAVLLDALDCPVSARRPTTASEQAADACLWCATRPAPHIVDGDALCEGCYRDHRTEVDR